jgi:membrane associated rhomboid family serine protease
MYGERTFIDDLKYQFRNGGATMRLIMINAAIFLVIGIIEVFARLSGPLNELAIAAVLREVFALHPDLVGFITHPWGLVTSIFAHFSFWHIAMNMLFLYFSGQLFEQLFDKERMLHTYVFGGIFGGVFEILAHVFFPVMQLDSTVVVGASGSIMAIFTALAFYRPQLKVHLFGILPVPLIVLAAFFILSDLFSLGMADGIAHFAHLGGAILGAFSVQQIYSKNNVITLSISLRSTIISFFKNLFAGGTKLKVKKGGQSRGPGFKKDEDYNLEKKKRQEKTDAILDKIAKSGYDSLTKAEKEFLFDQSKNG